MPQVELPPLTGSALFDPWRLRYRRSLEERGVELRERRPTKSEILLWEQLRSSELEWFAEVPTRYGYTLDFYCPSVQIAVEVDGGSHWGREGAERDATRDEVHNGMGIRTHRFSARHVETDPVSVLHEIEALVRRRAADLAGQGETIDSLAEPVADGEDLLDELLQEVAIPHQPTWSAYLPACRTILPTFAERGGLLGRLARRF